MASDLDDSALFERRESPKIGGSVAAFYVLVVLLVLVTIIASTAVVFLILEERKHGQKRRRYRATKSSPDDSGPKNPDSWYNRILGRSGPLYRDGEKGNASRSSQGWIQAGTGDDWETDSLNESNPGKSKTPVSSIHVNTLEYSPSLSSKQSHITSPQRSHSLASERSSSLMHGVRGLTYPDVYAPSPQRAIPSIQSQLYSPPSSPPSSTQHEPGWVLSTVPSSPVRVSKSPTPMSVSPVSFPEYSAEIYSAPQGIRKGSTTSVPSVHTFEGGTKFIESL